MHEPPCEPACEPPARLPPPLPMSWLPAASPAALTEALEEEGVLRYVALKRLPARGERRCKRSTGQPMTRALLPMRLSGSKSAGCAAGAAHAQTLVGRQRRQQPCPSGSMVCRSECVAASPATAEAVNWPGGGSAAARAPAAGGLLTLAARPRRARSQRGGAGRASPTPGPGHRSTGGGRGRWRRSACPPSCGRGFPRSESG